jgi:hypothetical protein
MSIELPSPPHGAIGCKPPCGSVTTMAPRNNLRNHAVSLRRFPLLGSRAISEGHYLDNGDTLASRVDSELCGEVTSAAGFPIPYQNGSHGRLELAPHR